MNIYVLAGLEGDMSEEAIPGGVESIYPGHWVKRQYISGLNVFAYTYSARTIRHSVAENKYTDGGKVTRIFCLRVLFV